VNERVIVTEDAVRKLIRCALAGEPIEPNPKVDPSRALTDTAPAGSLPHNRQELAVAINAIAKDAPVDDVPTIYASVKDALAARKKDDEEKMDKKVENNVRMLVRKIIKEMAGDDPFDLGQSADPRREKSYVMTPKDIPGASFGTHESMTLGDLAKVIDLSPAGAHRANAHAMHKFMKHLVLADLYPEEFKLAWLEPVKDYVDMLVDSDELDPEEVDYLTSADPSIVFDVLLNARPEDEDDEEVTMAREKLRNDIIKNFEELWGDVDVTREQYEEAQQRIMSAMKPGD
jgi:hypothetical protein